MLPESFDYTSSGNCKDLVLALTGLKKAPADLEGLLELSAGIQEDPEVPVFRPYFVAAAILDGQPNQKRVRKLKGIEFDNPSDTIAGLLRQQRMLDAALELTIPKGMSAVVASTTVKIVSNPRRGW